jgi:hypothetical protein
LSDSPYASAYRSNGPVQRSWPPVEANVSTTSTAARAAARSIIALSSRNFPEMYFMSVSEAARRGKQPWSGTTSM